MVSVGPYRFQKARVLAASSAARAGASASPPHRPCNGARAGAPLCSSICQVTGVACITVAPERAIRPARAMPSAASSALARTTRAPTRSGRKISSAAMSKEMVVMASSVSAAANPGRSRIAVRKLTSDRCVTATPLGLPVDPEV